MTFCEVIPEVILYQFFVWDSVEQGRDGEKSGGRRDERKKEKGERGGEIRKGAPVLCVVILLPILY